MTLAYRRPSIVEIFHAHRQIRQQPHPPRLQSASVSDPVQPGQAQHRFASWSTASALSAAELAWWMHERDLVDLGLIAPAAG